MAERRERDEPDERCFVQISSRPGLSMGVEVSTGRAWVGVDQQVGHGSADALFALTDAQYASALAAGWMAGPFLGECWRGDHPDLLLFHPGGAHWRPEQWHPSRSRMLPPRFAGELWRHIDAIGQPGDGEQAMIARRLAAGTAVIEDGPGGVQRITIPLHGDRAHPRPGALIAGLTTGSDRAQARAVLGEPVDASADVFLVEGARVELLFADDGLVGICLEPADAAPMPGGALGTVLAVLGEQEEGPRFQAAASLFGARAERWMASSGIARRLRVFDDGVEMQIEHDRVLSVRIPLRSSPGEPDGAQGRELLPGVGWAPARAEFHRALGAPADARGGTELHHLGARQLLVDYGAAADGETATAVTAVLTGVTVSHRFNRWRSGDFTMFLDVLGRAASNPLVAHVRGLRDVRLRLRDGVVAAVELDGRSGRFAGFIDGLPADPRRADIRFGAPRAYGAHDDLWDFEQGWLHVRSASGGRIVSIELSEDHPDGLAVQPWRFGRDSMEEWRRLSD